MACSHPRVAKEYILGAQTGDYKCLSCGKTDWGKDWVEEGLAIAKQQEEDAKNQRD
jgi:hypothetical protein